jgi:hypothetical protein
MDNTEKLSIYKTKIITTKIGVGHHSNFYPAMTSFTDQYSLPNIYVDIGQL